MNWRRELSSLIRIGVFIALALGYAAWNDARPEQESLIEGLAAKSDPRG